MHSDALLNRIINRLGYWLIVAPLRWTREKRGVCPYCGSNSRILRDIRGCPKCGATAPEDKGDIENIP